MWIVKYKDRPVIRFNDKQHMLLFIEEQSPAVKPDLTYEERRGIEPRKPMYPG